MGCLCCVEIGCTQYARLVRYHGMKWHKALVYACATFYVGSIQRRGRRMVLESECAHLLALVASFRAPTCSSMVGQLWFFRAEFDVQCAPVTGE